MATAEEAEGYMKNQEARVTGDLKRNVNTRGSGVQTSPLYNSAMLRLPPKKVI